MSYDQSNSTIPKSIRRLRVLTLLFALLCILALCIGGMPAVAQTLNWEGQTGVFVTPFAYVAPTPDKGFGIPVVSYHYLNAGNVLGSFHQVSISSAAFHRLEFGYTRNIHQEGGSSLSSLWSDGFNTFHGKLNVLPESPRRKLWLPAISVGFVVRSQVRNVGGVLSNRDTTNQDFYLVATKTVTQIPKLPLVLNLGVKGTNASLLGLAGNAPDYKARVFGSAAFVLKGPARSSILLAAEALQQPREIEGLPGAVVPTTLAYAVRIVPAGTFPSLHHGWGEERPRLTIDLGVAQIAGKIAPGVDLDVRHQFALGVSYQF